MSEQMGACPSCGAPLLEAGRFCASCGADLGGSAAGPAGVSPAATGSTLAGPDAGREPSATAATEHRRVDRRVFVAAGLLVVGGVAVALLSTNLLSSALQPDRCLTIAYRILPAGGHQPTQADADVIRRILDHRLADLTASASKVEAVGSQQVLVSLPCGLSDQDSIRAVLGVTGRLDFVPIPPRTTVSEGEQLDLTTYPPLFGASEIASAQLGTDQLGGNAIDFTLNSRGAALFSTYTQANIGKQFAIVLDGTIVAAPVIQSPITTGKGQITGGAAGLTPTQVNDLLTLLKYGSLPFPIQEVSVESPR